MRTLFTGSSWRSGPSIRVWSAYLYILPALVVYGLFVLLPVLQTVGYSLFAWDGVGTAQFVGLDNYRVLLSDTLFHTALRNNLSFLAFYTVLPIGLGLLLTVLLTRRRIHGLPLFRAGLFLPYVMSMVVVGVVWRWIYNPAFGPLNQALDALGLESWKRAWLGDFNLALPAVGIIATWVNYGFCLVLFIAGVQRIEEELYDAAKIDGAGGMQQLFNVTLPGLRSEIAVAAVTTLIAGLRVFDLIYVTTRGGPGSNTLVVSFHLYQNAFVLHRVGYAASIAVVMTVIILIVSFVVIQWRRRTLEDA